eukprot:5622490-Prorocentrum_lima.AAC.1
MPIGVCWPRRLCHANPEPAGAVHLAQDAKPHTRAVAAMSRPLKQPFLRKGASEGKWRRSFACGAIVQ